MLPKILTKRLARPLLICICCLAIFAGIFWARSHVLHDARWLWAVAAIVVVSLRKHNLATLLLISILGFGVGWWRGGEFMYRIATNEHFYGQKVTIVGIANDEAVYGKFYQLEFTLKDAKVVAPAHALLVGGITIRGFGAPMVSRGDTVQVTGKLNPTLGNNVASMSFANLTVLEHDTSKLNELRRKFAAGMQSALPEPAASFGLGLLIGQRTTLPDDISEQLRHVGLTHIIAVSGYNLTVIVIACRRLLAKRSKYQATMTCLLLIGIFLLITGSSPPIVRASVISLLGIGAWYYGRNLRPLVLLLVGGVVTVLANPLYLWGNVSWYLSFLSFFGVLYIAPLVTKRWWKKKEPSILAGVLIETICASIMVVPYVLYIFGQTSTVSLPANLLVVPFIPLAMLLSLAAGLAGMFLPLFAGWIAWPAATLLTYMLDAAAILARVPHAFIENIGFSWRAMAIGYATIGVATAVLQTKTRAILRAANHLK
ncbi:MAG TPA: ComEC/Rec2 family competence protein [Candidatus Saccharimonadales bacterium]|nr:ComEC/Rec2 family competence protein [Candidatus Saccharimonadales bacterium]